MNSITMLSSLKQIKLRKTNYILTRKWFIKKFARYNNLDVHKFFQQHQTLHTTITQLEIPKEIERKTTDLKHFRDLSKSGPSLKDFLIPETEISNEPISVPNIPYIQNIDGSGQKVYFEVYGCQMNVNDTEVIWSILKSHGYKKVDNVKEANIILIVTCSIRDNAEQKVWNKLTNLNSIKKKNKKFPVKVGLLGCMAERLKNKILEKDKLVDVIAGPDSYKDLPRLLSVPDDETAINVVLSFDETYADITPVRLNPNSTNAYVTIMRGCDNMCTYCIVPFTRGRERSRPIESIIKEVQSLSDDGVKEVMLLGQNVNSYRDTSQSEFYANNNMETHLAKDFKTVYKKKKGGRRFVDLLDEVSRINPEMRIRFTSPHPKDFPDEVLQLIAERPNICKEIHLPAQSGNSAVLERMRRGYTREAYINLVHRIREIIPNIYFSSDFITGFCGETEEEFQDTLSLIELVKYNKTFLFSYSMREKTTAHRRYKDDVPPNVKKDRLERMISVYKTEVEKVNKSQIGQLQLVLVEKVSKRSNERFQTRNDGNTRVLIPSMTIPTGKYSDDSRAIKIGDYVVVKIEDRHHEYHHDMYKSSEKDQQLPIENPPPIDQAALMARYIVNQADWVSVATLSTRRDVESFPAVNLISYTDGLLGNGSGVPYLYLTPLDFTAQDLAKDNRASLLMTLAQGEYCKNKQWDPMDPRCARILLSGKIKPLKNESAENEFAKKVFFTRHPKLVNMPANHHFYFAKLKIISIVVLDTFGGPKYVSVKDYLYPPTTNITEEFNKHFPLELYEGKSQQEYNPISNILHPVIRV